MIYDFPAASSALGTRRTTVLPGALTQNVLRGGACWVSAEITALLGCSVARWAPETEKPRQTMPGWGRGMSMRARSLRASPESVVRTCQLVERRWERSCKMQGEKASMGLWRWFFPILLLWWVPCAVVKHPVLPSQEGTRTAMLREISHPCWTLSTLPQD